jgi:hypothetical protein
MALPSYFHASPASGSGNGTVQISADVHSGRQNRNGIATITPTGGASAKTVSIIQTAAAEFVSFDQVSVTIGKLGGNISIAGRSNSRRLAFSLGQVNEIGLTLPGSFIAAGASATPNVDIPGDPGAVSAYNFSIVFTGIPENMLSDTLESILTAVTENGTSAAVTIQQTGVTATLSVSPTAITIPADGTAQAINIISNTNWTVS